MGEKHVETALREVFEESGVKATVMKYIGKSEYTLQCASGYRREGSPLVSNDGG